MLFTYVAADKYLKERGRLGFVITQVVFKTKGAGEGFRRFRIGQDGAYLGIIHVDDLVELNPFEGASNKTSILILQKNQKTKYPVAYTKWSLKESERINEDMTLSEIEDKTTRKYQEANPIGETEVGAWQTSGRAAARSLKKVLGKPAYKAWRGAGTDPYGVFWVNLIQRLPDGSILINNQFDAGKTIIPNIQATIEDKLLYPGLRGGGIKRWAYKPSGFVVLAQDVETRLGYPEDWMKLNLPKTYAYFRQFKEILENRKSSFVQKIMERSAFYAMYGIDKQILFDYKVCWQRASASMKAVVISHFTDLATNLSKPVIPADTTSYVAFQDETEAHYFCAVINSLLAGTAIRSFSEPGRGFGAPSILENIAIPKFESQVQLHNQLANLSRQAHSLAGKGEDIASVETEIDKATAKLWGISENEMRELKKSLTE